MQAWLWPLALSWTASLALGHGGHHASAGKRNLETQNPVLLMSFDGFRWDYVPRLRSLTARAGVTNHFEQLISSGAWAEAGIANAYSTVTFPNHYTLVTGLYEESHNIIGNTIFDPPSNRTYNLLKKEEKNASAFLYGGEPVWHTFAREKDPEKVGVYMWPGSDVRIRGHDPVPHHVVYRELTACDEPIDQAIDWLTKGFQLSVVYYHEPDKTGHAHGPFSPQVDQQLLDINACVGRLVEATHTMEPRPNLILTSDHGMTNFTKWIQIRPQPDLFRITNEHYSHFIVEPVAGKEAEALRVLKGYEPDIRVFPAAHIPDYLHYKNNPRIRGFLLMGRLGVSLSSKPLGKKWMTAGHGYDTKEADMRQFLVASGPGIRSGARVPSHFHSVDVYLLLCGLLGLVGAANNGSAELVHEVLSERGRQGSPGSLGLEGAAGSAAVVAAVSVGAVAWVLVAWAAFRCSHKRRPTLPADSSLRLHNGFLYKPVTEKLTEHTGSNDATSDDEDDLFHSP